MFFEILKFALKTEAGILIALTRTMVHFFSFRKMKFLT